MNIQSVREKTRYKGKTSQIYQMDVDYVEDELIN
jgi:hypothetical protein